MRARAITLALLQGKLAMLNIHSDADPMISILTMQGLRHVLSGNQGQKNARGAIFLRVRAPSVRTAR